MTFGIACRPSRLVSTVIPKLLERGIDFEVRQYADGWSIFVEYARKEELTRLVIHGT